MDDDLKFKHPFTAIISGPTGSGKSSFSIRLLQNLKSLWTVWPKVEFTRIGTEDTGCPLIRKTKTAHVRSYTLVV